RRGRICVADLHDGGPAGKGTGSSAAAVQALWGAHRRAGAGSHGHYLSRDRRRGRCGENRPGDRGGLRADAPGRTPDRTEAVMMKRVDCLKVLARHVTDADIVLPVYSAAFDWIDI